MFTGIVEEKGRVRTVRRKGRVTVIDLSADMVAEETKVGDSIAVNGVCLTVVRCNANILTFEVMPETLNATTLKELKTGEDVNLERALKVGDRLGGHFVTGHVDAVGVIRSRRISRGNLEFTIGVAPKFLKFAVRKGSVAVDGISLTIADVKNGAFCVDIIPHTAGVTTLGKKGSGNRVNVEMDMLVKSGRNIEIEAR